MARVTGVDSIGLSWLEMSLRVTTAALVATACSSLALSVGSGLATAKSGSLAPVVGVVTGMSTPQELNGDSWLLPKSNFSAVTSAGWIGAVSSQSVQVGVAHPAAEAPTSGRHGFASVVHNVLTAVESCGTSAGRTAPSGTSRWWGCAAPRSGSGCHRAVAAWSPPSRCAAARCHCSEARHAARRRIPGRSMTWPGRPRSRCPRHP